MVSVIGPSPAGMVMVSTSPGASPSLVSRIAWRREPAPLSALLVTVRSSTSAPAGATGPTRAAPIERMAPLAAAVRAALAALEGDGVMLVLLTGFGDRPPAAYRA